MISLPKGTKDVLPQESYKWHFVEEQIRLLAKDFGFKEIRTPTFEYTELFSRGVGETTDIVNKEMYTFTDKGDRSMTLKPEGTAGVARSFIENGLDNLPQPTKMFYLTPVFRYEKPQSGRLREHHQFGVELYGSDSPFSDVEVISLVKTLFDRLSINSIELNINNIGCLECRKNYAQALSDYFAKYISDMCPACKERLEKNPLRILDCKADICKKIGENAPIVLDYLCDKCSSHHAQVQESLMTLNIPYKVNPRIVRGLDYYTGTVFEFISTDIGSQGTVCGGGRYNNLVSDIGGKSVPAVGFGMGLERLIMVMESRGLFLGKDQSPQVYIAPLGDAQYNLAMNIVYKLRQKGISADTDLVIRSLKAQMKYADKIGYKYVVVIGENEIATNTAILKDMLNKNQRKIVLSEIFEMVIKEVSYETSGI
jgi:histidyl-tRNA synthetase